MQRGIALITAMLIVAIVAALATSLALGQQVWLRQTQNLTDLAQADLVRRGILETAAELLTEDAHNSQTNKIDATTEKWAQPFTPTIEGGTVLAVITDAQARFNLNNLVQQGKVVPDERRVFTDLLAVLGLPLQLVDPLIDWIDPDSVTTQPNGAEDLDYLNLDPPYRAANRALTSVDELRLIKGYSKEIVDKLQPFVIALPQSAGRTRINVNTASAEVLAALTGSDVALAQQWVKDRENNPYQSSGDFISRIGSSEKLVAGTFDVKSGYFIVSVQTRIGRVQQRTQALIERPSGNGASANVLWYRQPPLSYTTDEDKS